MEQSGTSGIPPLPKSWWGRNWKWFVPTGCLGVLLLLVVFVCSLFFVIASAMKSSDAYQQAFAKVRADPRVISALGTPIEPGFFVSGSTHVTGSSGDANLTIPISGPKGKGTVYVEATKFAREWTFSKLVVELDATGQKVDLMDEGAGNTP